MSKGRGTIRLRRPGTVHRLRPRAGRQHRPKRGHQRRPTTDRRRRPDCHRLRPQAGRRLRRGMAPSAAQRLPPAPPNDCRQRRPCPVVPPAAPALPPPPATPAPPSRTVRVEELLPHAAIRPLARITPRPDRRRIELLLGKTLDFGHRARPGPRASPSARHARTPRSNTNEGTVADLWGAKDRRPLSVRAEKKASAFGRSPGSWIANRRLRDLRPPSPSPTVGRVGS